MPRPPSGGGPRRLLVVTTEPPPTSSGLGTLWAKLCMGAVGEDLLVDFLGPDPGRCSNHGDSGLPARYRLHDLGPPPLSRLAAVRRSTAQGARRLAWSAVRAPSALLERASGRDLYVAWMRRRVASRLPELLASRAYDLVVAKAPPLELAETAFRIAADREVPFAYFMGEPVDHRNEAGTLDPASHERQQALIDGSAAFLTARSAYEAYHERAFRIDPGRLVFLGDSFLPVGSVEEREPAIRVGEDVLLHWGQVAPWRDLGTLIDALVAWRSIRAARGLPPLGLTVMGRIVDRGMRARATRELGPLLVERKPLPYRDARAVARTARRFVVITSHRHRDNIPSKLIDALAYGRPILLLTHPESAAAGTVRRLGVGPVADVRDVASILEGLRELEEGAGRYEAAYASGGVAGDFGFEGVGRRFREQLFRAMGWRGPGRSSP